ncbi:MAG TPA: DUF5652 family protein [bacterium]|nr:DUF5652 family protein [bacterium]HPL95719.1 DUF5652 family protein [bacterium]
MEQLLQNQNLLLLILVWSLFWKGLALWRAARKNDRVWYIVILIVNLLGLESIVYLLVTKSEEKPESKEN